MHLVFLSEYRKDGQIKFLYEVVGSKKDVKLYVDHQTEAGFSPVNDEGQVLYSAKNVLPPKTPLKQAKSGGWFPDTSFWDIFSNLKSQYPAFSDDMIKEMMPKSVTNPVTPQITEGADDLGKG